MQVYETAGQWQGGELFAMPHPVGPGGLYEDIVNVAFRASPTRAQTIPGVDIIVRKTPRGHSAVWDTRGEEGVVFDLPNSLSQVSWPNGVSNIGSTGQDGCIIGGAVHGDLFGQGVSRHAAVWRDFGEPQLLGVPAGTMASEVWAVSGDGGFAYGAISEQGMPSDQPKMKPTNARAIRWNPSQPQDYHIVEASIAGPEATSIWFTGISDDGQIATATISTTRSNAKGGLVSFQPGGGWTLLDGGDINGDGSINMLDDHDSDVYGLSDDASVVGGSITVGRSGQTAMLWLRNASGQYVGQDLSAYLASIGATGLTGWSLGAVTGVSGNGQTITGWGIAPNGMTNGWVATIPSPGGLAMLGVAGLIAGRRKRPAS